MQSLLTLDRAEHHFFAPILCPILTDLQSMPISTKIFSGHVMLHVGWRVINARQRKYIFIMKSQTERFMVGWLLWQKRPAFKIRPTKNKLFGLLVLTNNPTFRLSNFSTKTYSSNTSLLWELCEIVPFCLFVLLSFDSVAMVRLKM